MTLYTNLASAKDTMRRAKDHEQAMRAIAEYVELSGKNADDRKRELAFSLSQDVGYRKALDDLRDAEYAVDQAQAAIDQAEMNQRAREYALRCRELEAQLGSRSDDAQRGFDQAIDDLYPPRHYPNK